MSTFVREHGNWDQSWVNFKPEEFRCSHCQALNIHSDIMDLLQEAREEGGLGPINITSGYRCGIHNSQVSKTGLSGPHTTGKAVDISVRDSQHRKQIITYFAPIVTGLGIAKSFIHIDLLTADDGFEMRPNCWVY
jgi:zinc D-Ala-D-Ala carboxypeptidase